MSDIFYYRKWDRWC